MATATKAKKAAASGAEAETVLKKGTESLKDGFEKLSQSYEQVGVFNKETAEAVIESAAKAGKGIETINAEVYEYSRQLLEDGVSATKSILAAKTLQEMLDRQSRYTKEAFEAHVAQMSKIREMALETAKTASEPLQARVEAFAELVQNQAA
jgi:phasin family protein